MKTYSTAYIYTKKGNLLPYMETKIPNPTERQKEYYGTERDIELILLVRYDKSTRRTLCRIKCPINPIPLKGEFEVASATAIRSYLNRNGWLYKQTVHRDMFNA